MKENLDALFLKYIKASKIAEDAGRRLGEIEEKLKHTLNHDEKVLFNDYTDVFYEHLQTCSGEYFKQGFWVGCEIMREFQE